MGNKLARLALWAVLLGLLQALLVPKYQTMNPEGSLIRDYYRETGTHDVIFFGDCEVYEGVSPITLWQEHGIPAWLRGSPQQTVWQSYYLMEETFRRETPAVAVFNVLAMQYDTPESTGNLGRREAYNRMTLDAMAWSASKWKAIQASLTEEERQWEGALTYLFPILRFHDRWRSLTAEDFQYWLSRDTVSHNGYLMQTGVVPMTDAKAEPPRESYAFGENAWEYLDRMRVLCQEKGVRLVLVKSPVLYPVWWWEWEAQMERYAEAHGLLYLNLLEAPEIGIDWSQDTYDGGSHLNVYGAEKAASWLGGKLKEAFSLPDRREDPTLAQIWEQKTAAYEKAKAAGEKERTK